MFLPDEDETVCGNFFWEKILRDLNFKEEYLWDPFRDFASFRAWLINQGGILLVECIILIIVFKNNANQTRFACLKSLLTEWIGKKEQSSPF